MTPYAHLSPMTDTRDLSAVIRGIPLSELETIEMSVLDLKPDLPTRRRAIPARVRVAAIITAATLGAAITHLLAVTA